MMVIILHCVSVSDQHVHLKLYKVTCQFYLSKVGGKQAEAYFKFLIVPAWLIAQAQTDLTVLKMKFFSNLNVRK